MNREQKAQSDHFAGSTSSLVRAPIQRIGYLIERPSEGARVRRVFLISLPDSPESLMYVGAQRARVSTAD